MTTTYANTQEMKNRQRSKRITTTVHAIILAVLLLPFMNSQLPEPQDSTTVVVDFRDFKSAAKKSSTKKANEANGVKKEAVEKPVVKETPTPKPTPVPTAKKKPVEIDKKAETPIKTKPTVADKPVEVPLDIPVDEVPEVPMEKPEVKPEPKVEATPEKTTEATTTTAEGAGKDAAGSTAGEGTGTQGSSDNGDSNTDGVADEGDNGMDFSGDGIFNRRVTRRADVKKITTETGKIVINLCINPSGKVVHAEYNEEASTIDTPKVVRKAIQVATEYRFERDYTAPKKQCGKLSFIFDIEEE